MKSFYLFKFDNSSKQITDVSFMERFNRDSYFQLSQDRLNQSFLIENSISTMSIPHKTLQSVFTGIIIKNSLLKVSPFSNDLDLNKSFLAMVNSNTARIFEDFFLHYTQSVFAGTYTQQQYLSTFSSLVEMFVGTKFTPKFLTYKGDFVALSETVFDNVGDFETTLKSQLEITFEKKIVSEEETILIFSEEIAPKDVLMVESDPSKATRETAPKY